MNEFEKYRAAFAALVPDLTRMALAQFRDRDPEAREEAVSATLALVWYRYVGLIREGRGSEPGIVQSVLWFSIKQVRAGRTLPTGDDTKPKDAFVYAKRGLVTFEALDLRGFESRGTPVPDVVAFRVDFTAFLGTLNDRQREITLDLMGGMGTGECAAKHCVTAGAISQTRTRIADLYADFVAG